MSPNMFFALPRCEQNVFEGGELSQTSAIWIGRKGHHSSINIIILFYCDHELQWFEAVGSWCIIPVLRAWEIDPYVRGRSGEHFPRGIFGYFAFITVKRNRSASYFFESNSLE